MPKFHPHPRIKHGTGSNPPPQGGGNNRKALGTAQGNRIWNPKRRYCCFCGGVGPQNSVFTAIFCHSVPWLPFRRWRVCRGSRRFRVRATGIRFAKVPRTMVRMRHRGWQGGSVTGFQTEISLTQFPVREKKAYRALLHFTQATFLGRALPPWTEGPAHRLAARRRARLRPGGLR